MRAIIGSIRGQRIEAVILAGAAWSLWSSCCGPQTQTSLCKLPPAQVGSGTSAIAGTKQAEAGCPNQTTVIGPASLASLLRSNQAVVRIYNAPIYSYANFATHQWFVVKRANAEQFDRWEVWQTAGGPYGHIRKNLMNAERDVGAGGVKLVAELLGPAAEPIVEFIETQSPTYPCRGKYFVLGPNSNTYPQWVLNETGWNVKLPASAIGKDAPVDCP